MQRVENFGSLLQSYALKSILENLGHTVFFIDIEKRDEENTLLKEIRQKFQEELENGGDRTFLSKLTKVDRYFWNRLSNKMKLKAQSSLLENFRVNNLGMGTGSEASNRNYDVCVIGSDEVFNCMTESSWGFTSQLFGDVRQAKRVITYAASCGATSYDMLPKAVDTHIRTAFCRITGFSVRDLNTENFVSHFTEKQIHTHLDPVLLDDFSAELARVTKLDNLPERYCLVYAYYNRIYKQEEIQTIMQFCSENNLEIVTVGAPQLWTRKHLVVTPFEALAVFAKAAFVITDTFHGTIFAVKYASRFAVITRASNRNKLLDLISRLGVERHLIESMTELHAAYEMHNDQERLHQIEKEERRRTIEYLVNVI